MPASAGNLRPSRFLSGAAVGLDRLPRLSFDLVAHYCSSNFIGIAALS